MSDLIVALGLVLVLEGFLFAAFPAATRRAMAMLMEAPEASLRVSGIAAAVFGVALIWLVRS